MKIKSQFADCPTVCSKNGAAAIPSYDENRFEFCAVCPHKSAKGKFRQLFDLMIEQRFGNKPGKVYRFNDLLNLLYDARNMEDVAKEKLSVKSAVLLGVYLQAKNRYEREQDEKRSKK